MTSHIYWMTFKEYYKWSKSQNRIKNSDEDKIHFVRTHIFFTK